MNNTHHGETGSTAEADSKPRDAMLWTRLKGAAFLTGVGVAVVVAMFGWLGGLALAMLEICEFFFS